ncbi:MAG: OmpH family outer membrane protein [Bacteroidetes bacterium]|nr:OmpH family outer membrane protein [Bacteroidota bacterium]
MKKLVALLWIFSLALSVSFAQKLGYVDTEMIMGKIPEYKAAQDEIERVSEKWQKELEGKYQEIERLYADYQAQEVLLPEDVKQEKQDEIFNAEREAKEYREKKFGYNGELFALQDSKVKPIQDKVFRAVETVAQRKRIDMVYDKAGEVTWLYTNAIYDLSNEVLKELGYDQEENSAGNRN